MPTMKQLYKGLDPDEIGEITAQMHAEGLETIDWKNLTDEQVDVIMNNHDCKTRGGGGCSVCCKLADAGKIPNY